MRLTPWVVRKLNCFLIVHWRWSEENHDDDKLIWMIASIMIIMLIILSRSWDLIWPDQTPEIILLNISRKKLLLMMRIIFLLTFILVKYMKCKILRKHKRHTCNQSINQFIPVDLDDSCISVQLPRCTHKGCDILHMRFLSSLSSFFNGVLGHCCWT